MNTQDVVSTLNISPDAQALLLTLVNENNALREEIQELKADQEHGLLPTVEAMKVLGCGRKKFWELSKEEGFPRAIKFGITNHYKRTELEAFRDNHIMAG